MSRVIVLVRLKSMILFCQYFAYGCTRKKFGLVAHLKGSSQIVTIISYFSRHLQFFRQKGLKSETLV